MLKKLLLAGVLSLASLPAFAANCAIGTPTTVSGSTTITNPPLEPGQALANQNALIQTLNNCVAGSLGALTATVTTSGTSANAVFSTTIPVTMLKIGNTFRVHAWGVNSGDANVKTITLNYGLAPATVAVIVTGNAATWDAWFDVILTGAATQVLEGHGVEGTTVIAATAATGTEVATAPITLAVTATAATSGTTAVKGLTTEVIQ